MTTRMNELRISPFIKCMVIKVDLFGSKIIDEGNFGIDEEWEIMNFKKKYVHRDDCILVKVKM